MVLQPARQPALGAGVIPNTDNAPARCMRRPLALLVEEVQAISERDGGRLPPRWQRRESGVDPRASCRRILIAAILTSARSIAASFRSEIAALGVMQGRRHPVADGPVGHDDGQDTRLGYGEPERVLRPESAHATGRDDSA